MKLTFCVACLAIEDLHHHHLVPKALGGSDKHTNFITLCHPCHAKIHGRRVSHSHSELTKAGMQRRRDMGLSMHRPPYGMKISGMKHIKNAGEQKIIRKILSMRSKGFSFRMIGAELDKHGLAPRSGKKWRTSSLVGIFNRYAG